MKLVVNEKDGCCESVQIEYTPTEALIINHAMRRYVCNDEVNEEDRTIMEQMLDVKPMFVDVKQESSGDVISRYDAVHLADELKDDNDENAAERVGHRIRKIREARKMSLAELGEQVGISADMLQKYENGQRKPKTERLKEMAKCLGVSSLALTDPALTGYVSTMFALFEMEENHGLTAINRDGHTYLMFTGSSSQIFNKYLNKWINKRESVNSRMDGADDEEKAVLKQEYYDWEWTFPEALAWKPSKGEKEKEIEALEKRLKELKGED